MVLSINMMTGGTNQLDHLMKSRSRWLTTNSRKGTSLGLIEMSSVSSASQFTEFRKKSALSLLKKKLFLTKSESVNTINLDRKSVV